jgi:rubrerythrin
MKKKWICTVCGYIHEGPEPPSDASGHRQNSV